MNNEHHSFLTSSYFAHNELQSNHGKTYFQGVLQEIVNALSSEYQVIFKIFSKNSEEKLGEIT